MHHAMLDRFAAADTPVHRLDPVAKTVSALGAILATVLVGRDHLAPFAAVGAALVVYHAVSRLPVLYALKRLLAASPFALAVVVFFPFFEPGPAVAALEIGPWTVQVTEPGLLRAAHLLSKFVLCAWASLLLLATTRFQDVLAALERLRVPRAFVMQLAFLYRYLWVLLDELMHLRMARAARDGGAGPWGVRFRASAGLVGVLFLRTYGRAERIYWAMAARGFDGKIHAAARPRMRLRDAVFLAAVLAGGAGLIVLDRVAYG